MLSLAWWEGVDSLLSSLPIKCPLDILVLTDKFAKSNFLLIRIHQYNNKIIKIKNKFL